MEIGKGDKIVLVDEDGYASLSNMADFFEVISVQEINKKLRIQTRFKYNSKEAWKQGKRLGNVTKGMGDYYYVNFTFSRLDAKRFIRKYEHKFKIID